MASGHPGSGTAAAAVTDAATDARWHLSAWPAAPAAGCALRERWINAGESSGVRKWLSAGCCAVVVVGLSTVPLRVPLASDPSKLKLLLLLLLLLLFCAD